ncbi:ABC-2 family transporter protein [Gottschalkia purinilytica]|uniref:ABC-2 family transporter protein n=1 Tax=Gottschalkia purinilytica TaxID=1503 RepID=A0A0L0WD85_GOTPU|nr:ABC transporter permease subunit [Gottschalkia purinilytica]KNF09390.1 ABC-2 family transporter protein [Gottschalkia purinilytica]
MKSLFISEFERLWTKKNTWLIFISIPLVLYASAKYYLSHNVLVTTTSPEFTSFANFPIAAMQEQLITFFNLAVILLLVLSVTEEYRTGQIRMIMIRQISFSKLFFAKFITVIITIFLLITAYYFFSIPIGYLLMPKLEKVSIFYHNELFATLSSFIYGVKYYLLSFLTLIAMASTIMFISTVSQTVTTGVGLSIGFLLSSIIYPQILLMFFGKLTMKVAKLQFLSLTHIQHMGIAISLGEYPSLVGWNFSILLIYTTIFTVLSYLCFTKTSKYI